LEALFKTNTTGDPTARCAEAKILYRERIEMVVQTCKETDLGLWDYILVGVTEGVSYDQIKLG